MTTADILREIAADRQSGAAALAARGLDAFDALSRQGVPEQTGRDCEELARRLDDVRPSMGAIGAQAILVLAQARGLVSQGTDWPTALRRAVFKQRETLASAQGRIASIALEHVGRERVIATCSWSATVLRALLSLSPGRVVVADGGGLGDGLRAARWLASREVSTQLTPDSAICAVIQDSDAVLIGADQILTDGSVVNRTGSLAMALAAGYAGKPVYVLCQRIKLFGRGDFDPQRYDPGYGPLPPELEVRSPLLEAVPAGLVTRVLTDNGALRSEDVRRAVAGMARLREGMLGRGA